MGYLPAWATLEESQQWLNEATGEDWPLPRLLEHGVWPRVWLTPDGVPPAVMKHVFEDRHEGFLAEFVFAGDTQRLAADRTAALGLTRTPSGLLVRFTPPVPVGLDELRFSRDDLKALAAGSTAPRGPQVKRKDLIARNLAQWPTIDQDLREASRRHPGLAAAMAGNGKWHEGEALAWARDNGRLSPQGAPGLPRALWGADPR